MAACAPFKLQAGILHDAIATRGMALFATHLPMSAGQCKSGLRVIEVSGVLPIVCVMALLAFASQLTFVLVFVARSTGLVQPQVGAVRVFDLNAGALGRVNSRGVVTLRAGEAAVFAIEGKSGVGVLECRGPGIKTD